MKYCSATDKGLVRERNEDNYSILENDNSDVLFIVCDGIGGNKAGDVASKEVCKCVSKLFKTAKKFKNGKEVKKFITLAINDANNVLLDLSSKFTEYHGLGTTITGIIISGKSAYSFNVGDSRVYGIKKNKIKQLTTDDTLVNFLVEEGKITKEEAKTHPKRSHLIKAVGIDSFIDVPCNKLDYYDYFVICSDGLYSMVDDQNILSIMTNKDETLESKTKKLIHEALLKGGYDNITVITVESNGK